MDIIKDAAAKAPAEDDRKYCYTVEPIKIGQTCRKRTAYESSQNHDEASLNWSCQLAKVVLYYVVRYVFQKAPVVEEIGQRCQ